MKTFEEWMKQVDRELNKVCGLTHLDLCDAPYRDNYEDEVTPKEMAEIALVEWNDFPEDLFEEMSQ